LLKMMGWTEGTGLGTTGEGIVDPIQTAMYAQGAGLGASKGKDISKYETGYTGYVHQAQDAVSKPPSSAYSILLNTNSFFKGEGEIRQINSILHL